MGSYPAEVRNCARQIQEAPNVGWDKPVTIDKTCLRDGPLLVLAYSLVQDLLDFSRIGRIADPPQVNQLGDLLARALQILEITIKEADAQVKVPSTLPSVCCRGGEIVRVFQNLIGNAVKFRALERRPVIEISCQRQGETWQFSVSDNGIGIDPSYNDRVFMIFQRLHTRDKYEGTGIGLAVCKKIIEQHGGRIWVEGKPGQGSTFFFTLPAAQVV